MYESKIPASSDNSKDALIEWSLRALEEAKERGNITQIQANFCHAKSLEVIRIKGYRGDISDAWRKMGFEPLEIPAMFV